MLPSQFPKLHFRLKSVFVLMLGIAIGYSLNKWPAPLLVRGNTGMWSLLGLNLSEEQHSTFDRRKTRYRGGMRVDSVRPNSAAAQEGILPGDILVGLHKWQTASDEDIQYIISQLKLDQKGKLKFFVLRDQSTLYGHLSLAPAQ